MSHYRARRRRAERVAYVFWITVVSSQVVFFGLSTFDFVDWQMKWVFFPLWFAAGVVGLAWLTVAWSVLFRAVVSDQRARRRRLAPPWDNRAVWGRWWVWSNRWDRFTGRTAAWAQRERQAAAIRASREA